MKKFLVLLFSSLLILGACGNNDSSNEDDSDKKSETKSNDPNKNKKSDDKKKEKEEKDSNEDSNSEKSTSSEENENENPKDNNSDNQASEEQSYPYTAQQYNELVDEYNALTDDEQMDHVSRGVTEIEYSQLSQRVSNLSSSNNTKDFNSEPSTSVDNVEHDNSDDLVTASEYNSIVDEYNTMKNRPGNKSRVSNSVPQSQYNTLVDEYNALVDEEYEEAGY